MRRKLLSVVLCVCMMMTMAPFAFAAGDGDDEAASGQASSTLQAQINSASSPITIKLEQDYTETITIPEGKTITLDLNEHNLTASTGDAIVNRGTLTIKGSGQVSTTKTDSAAIANFPNAVANVNGGTYISAEWYVIKNLGTMTIDGAVTVKKPDGSTNTASLIDNGWVGSADTVATESVTAQADKASLTIKSGNFNGKSGQNSCSVVKNDDYGTLRIFGGTFDSTANTNANNSTTILNWNVAEISGGTFTGKYPISNGAYTGDADKGQLTISGGTFTGTQSMFGYGQGGNGVGQMTISGGSFTAPQIGDFTGKYTLSISGGTFSLDPASYLATGYSAKSSNGKYLVVPTKADNAVAQIVDTYYNTLADAVADASNSTITTITLLKDTTFVGTIYIRDGKNILLDLNGHNITSTDYFVFKVYNANFHVTGRGTISENVEDGYSPIIASGSADANASNYTVVTIDKDVTLKSDYCGLFVAKDSSNTYLNYGLVINMFGTIDLLENGISGYGMYINGQNQNMEGNVPVFNLDGARIVGDTASGIYAAGYAKWNLKNTTITSPNALALKSGEFIIDSGSYTSTGAFCDPAEANGNGSEDTGAALSMTSNDAYAKKLNVTVNGGTFTSKNGYAVYEGIAKDSKKNKFAAEQSYVSLAINGGNFAGSNDKASVAITKATNKNVISGGYFTSDPSAYCTNNLTGISSGLADYPWMVGTKSETKAEVASGAPTVKTDLTYAEDSPEKALLEATKTALASADVDGNGIATAAADLANNNTVTADENVVGSLNSAIGNGSTQATSTNTNIVIQTYMDMKITDVSTDADKKSITIDIQPMYRTVATTADVANDGEIVLEASTTKAVNAVQVGDPKPLTITGETTVTIQLPAGFVSKDTTNNTYPNVYVQHKGHEYTATVTATTTEGGTTTLIATFTNPDAFSPFTISTDPTAVATIGTNRYTTLQAAVDAVQNGEIINLEKDCAETVTVSRAVNFTLNKDSQNFTGTISAGSRYSMTTATETNGTKYTFTYVGGGSSSSGSTTTYNVNVNAATNGTVAADKKTAAKGTTVTVTATASSGYVVDSVKVVDKDGKDVAVTAKDGKYVFTMPGSAVTVTGTFKAETPAESGLPFTDVKSGDWFYDAVKYAYENGLMTGTAATTFAPNGTMNRAMIVTVLYRLEKSPAVTAASKFTDVPAGQWYSDAVAWAAANNIVNGYSETSFGPMNAVTREQMAAILFRYEQYKGLENVTLEENLNRFPDQDKISSYAVPAMQWAVGQKIINGNADGTLNPTGTATRAQVAQIFTNLLSK